MLDPTKLPLFAAASLALLLSPGPAVLYIVARSIDQGRKAGLVSVLSIEAGNFCHVLAAALGLSALLLASDWAFSAVKYAGAAYLIFLGLRKWTSRPVEWAAASLPVQSSRSIFTQGMIVAILNPKTALFFLAFLPQFVDRDRGGVTAQIFWLGCIFVGMACLTDSLYALLAGTAGRWLKRSPGWLRGQELFAGSVYVGLGLLTVLGDVLGK
jgi:threonine/homoserine/homoserine lactone efflux protein